MAGSGERPLALVTGASSGFGLLTAVALARAGHDVLATMREPARRTALDEAARAAGVADRVRVARLDVTDGESIAACADAVHAERPALGVLVNNAGYGLMGFAEDVSEAELRAQMETNFFGLVRTTLAFAPRMREAGAGTIVNVSSGFGQVGMAFSSAYCASKFAVEGWSESLRYELGAFGVRVVLIQPGAFRTDIWTRNRNVARRTSDATSPWHARSRRVEAFIARRETAVRNDPELVAETIVRAVRARRPRLRWAVPAETAVQVWLRKKLPARLFEGAIQAFAARLLR